jgi:hypothetical protein
MPRDPGRPSPLTLPQRAGITLSEAKRAFRIQGDDSVGAVADTTARRAEANINITAAAATSAGGDATG